MIPFPFSKGVLVIGTPIWVPKRLSPEDMEYYREKVERGIEQTTHEADILTE